jgi:hypothetical protein
VSQRNWRCECAQHELLAQLVILVGAAVLLFITARVLSVFGALAAHRRHHDAA